MPGRHDGRSRAALAGALLALIAALLLSGCSGGDVSLSSLSQKVNEGVDRATGSVDDLKAKAADAGLDAEALAQVKDATTTAGEAIAKARSALDAASAAGQTASTQVSEARTALDAAKAKVEALAGTVGEPLATAVSGLAGQLDSLAAELAELG